MTLDICSYRSEVVINDTIYAHMHDAFRVAHGHSLLVLLLLTCICRRLWLHLKRLIL